MSVPLARIGQVTAMLEAARQFHAAAVRCGMALDVADQNEWLPYPEVVNYAFAAEVALKGLLLTHTGTFRRGHDLAALCASLPTGVVDRVRGPHTVPALFKSRVYDVRNAFEVWRYAFERNEMQISLTFLSTLSEEAISVLNTDLEVFRR